MSDEPVSPASPTPPPGRVYEVLTPGEQLGEYTVEACLAYDILGSLYRVGTFSGEEKNLFVLPKILTDDETFMRRFKDLREKLRQMSHPAVLCLGESVNIEGRICFVAEPFHGKSVPEYLGAAGIYPTYRNPQGIVRAHPSEEAKDFTPQKIRVVTHTMLEALEHAHGKGALHLNLTPSNILLATTGETKVLGFGLYSIIGQAAIEALVSAGIPAVSLGPRNVRLNTADIIPPEVHLKQEPDARADIYAVGMSTYWMLTGLKPTANYRPPSGIVPGLEPGWDIFLARCLAREKGKRYANASAALRDLEMLEKLTTTGYADDPARAGAATPKSRLPKKALLVAGSAVLLAAAFTAWSLCCAEESTAVDRVPTGSAITRAVDAGVAYIFKIEQSGVRVTASSNHADFGVTNGELRLAAPAGHEKFTITAPGMTARVIELAYDGKRPRTTVIKLAKNAGILEVVSVPSAEVFIVDADATRLSLGLTDAQGHLLAAGVAAGTFSVEVEKEGCKTAVLAAVQIKVGEKTSKNIAIEGANASLALTSTLSGVQVTVNGGESGETPLKLDKLKPGIELTVVFSKENYRPVTRKIILDAGAKITLDSGPMLAAKGTVSYALTFSGKPADADRLRDLTAARSDDGMKRHNWAATLALPTEISVGYYVMKVDHPDYEPFQTAFTIDDNKNTRVDIPLHALPAPLELTLSPAKLHYTLRINSREYVDEAPATVPAGIPLHIEIEARDYDVWRTDLVAAPRHPVALAATLTKLTSPDLGKAYAVPYLGIVMAWVAPGETRLGSPAAEAGHTAVEAPFTWAAFKPGFWMGATEVSQSEFERVLGYNPSRHKHADHPVDSVSHNDVIRFCQAMNDRETKAGRIPLGYEYRLPNELEWEYACRAGTTTAFAFGASASTANGNFLGTYPADDVVDAEGAAPRTVASYPANAYGIHDMHGNVREWVLEQYKPHLPGGRRTNHTPDASALSGPECTTRGGSFRTRASDCRSAARPLAPIKPGTAEDDLGFRLVLGPVAKP